MGHIVSRETMNAAIQKHQVPRPSLENILNEAIDAEISQGNLCVCGDSCGCDEPQMDEDTPSMPEDDTDAVDYSGPFSQ